MKWLKSNFCESSHCVEVAFSAIDDTVLVRDSKDVDGLVVLRFTGSEWRAFVEGVKADEFHA